MRSHTHKRRIPHGFLIDLTNPGAICKNGQQQVRPSQVHWFKNLTILFCVYACMQAYLVTWYHSTLLSRSRTVVSIWS